ncbi:glycosyltransferase [Rhizobium skierniewicense]|uniref:glycosyltransferase n=1 Tax=Rhizobium skierniewicense TaxID=984260 RepID=UPI0015745E63|nr:glycosyltransferase [Rhizobium skierniewicense]NTF33470.1 glycosyltransferase [Rhizobium skierniewicense]
MTFSNPTPRISIVTPSLNQGRFLQECIDSVRSQNWPDIEHFIIDGGSSDNTLEVVRQNEDWLTGYVSEPDKGAADAINKGLSRCTGDIIAWLNADDFYLPGAFEHIVEAYRVSPQASFWFGNGIRTDEGGNKTADFIDGRVLYNEDALLGGLDYILQPSTFMNATYLRRLGRLNQSLRWSFDWDLWIRLAKLSTPHPVEASLAASREWGDTLTATGGFRRVEELRLLAERHTGRPMTPGALCYWLDNMHRTTQSSELFSDQTQGALLNFWNEVQADMQRLGVNAAGSPVPSAVSADEEKTPDNAKIIIKQRIVIAVDLYPLIAGVSGGIVPWVHGVLREMVRLFPNDKIVFFHRPGLPPLAIKSANVDYICLDEHPALFYAEMSEQCANLGVDAILRTYPQEAQPDFPLQRQVFVIPDIQHEYFPDFFPKDVLASRRRAFADALSRGGAIATMTDHSRNTMVSNAWTMTDDVFLMPAALPEELQETPTEDDLPSEAKSFERFFYMPANLWPHKNHRRLFEAFKLALPDLPPKTGLVLTGNPDGLQESLKGFEDLPIVHLGFLPHRQVAALFAKATALVYFSLFEGFGMPLLEAFHHGTPVLCSNTTSLPEVGGDAVLACDPTDIAAMANLMRRITTEEGLRASLSDKAKLRVAAYDWVKPAQSLRDALLRVSKNPLEYARKEPLVSIVMPTRNHGHFIRESIDSVLNQGYKNVELLVMDGASTDDTVEVLKSYGDRIKWVSERDKGQADAINKGMERVGGEILAYLNSDDILLPGALEAAVQFFNEHPECDMVYGNADYIDAQGAIIGTYNSAPYSFERLMHDCCVCQPASFWRKRIVDRIGPFDVSMQTAMDYEYWLRMATSGAIILHSDHKFAQSRLHEDAKTLAMRGVIYREVFEICARHGGYVSLSYYFGFWAYRLYETWPGGSRLRRTLPNIHRIPATLGFLGQAGSIGRDRARLRYVARGMFRVVDRRLPWAGSLIRKAWFRSASLRRRFR